MHRIPISSAGSSVRAANNPLITTTFQVGAGNSGAWTVAPAAYRRTVTADPGNLLVWNPPVLAPFGALEFQFDLASIDGSANPLRYASSRTAVQNPNGHGGLYVGGAYAAQFRPLTWTVTAADLVAGAVTLALLYRAGTDITIGSAGFPSELALINLGTPGS
jgi:hypothetical protein